MKCYHNDILEEIVIVDEDKISYFLIKSKTKPSRFDFSDHIDAWIPTDECEEVSVKEAAKIIQNACNNYERDQRKICEEVEDLADKSWSELRPFFNDDNWFISSDEDGKHMYYEIKNGDVIVRYIGQEDREVHTFQGPPEWFKIPEGAISVGYDQFKTLWNVEVDSNVEYHIVVAENLRESRL